MKNKYTLLSALLIVTACGSPTTDDVASKKAALDKAKKEMAVLSKTISDLEKEISATDSTFVANRNAILVAPVRLEKKPFEHYVELRGTVESRKNVFLSTSLGGEIERVHVKEGQEVSKGQLLVSLDADVLESSLADLKSSYSLAKTIYEKQEKLWSQKVGTEVQYLQAKNVKESLENKIEALRAQIDQMMVKAPFNGTIDKVNALEGQVASPGFPLVRMVNAEDMYVKADVSENFIGKFKAGDKAELYFYAQDQKVMSTVASVGQVINPENRTFEVEVKLLGVPVKPNQIALVTMRDYINQSAYTLPTKLIQRDNKGQFVFIVAKKGNQNIAKKAYIETGVSYNGNTEIKEGLNGDELVVGEGFREVEEGVEINLYNSDKSNATVSK